MRVIHYLSNGLLYIAAGGFIFALVGVSILVPLLGLGLVFGWEWVDQPLDLRTCQVLFGVLLLWCSALLGGLLLRAVE